MNKKIITGIFISASAVASTLFAKSLCSKLNYGHTKLKVYSYKNIRILCRELGIREIKDEVLPTEIGVRLVLHDMSFKTVSSLIRGLAKDSDCNVIYLRANSKKSCGNNQSELEDLRGYFVNLYFENRYSSIAERCKIDFDFCDLDMVLTYPATKKDVLLDKLRKGIKS